MAIAFHQTYTFTIANGASLSGVVDLGAGSDFGGTGVQVTFFVPSGWDAAAVNALLSLDGVNFFPMSSGLAEFTVVPGLTPSTAAVTAVNFAGARYVKFRSGTAAAPVNQTADRVFTMVLARPAT
jgi:hypothetical protein